ncbi:MAG: hypothetical protein OEU92_34570 [Alphaproteobacteria bacterium]|nr:hypothetical protein [Alphaproteobacteria bacterium]
MIFSPRDAQILRWINGHGFATGRQVADWLGVRYQSIHPRLKFLTDAGYLRSQRVGHNLLALRLTKAGVTRCGDDLPPLRAIRFGSFFHDLQLIDLATKLTKQTGGQFTTERRLRQERGFKGVGLPTHIPDGLLKLDGKPPIAIELELSTKGWQRLQNILQAYAADFSLGEVWYFAGNDALRRRLESAAEGYAFVRVFSFAEEALSLQTD